MDRAAAKRQKLDELNRFRRRLPHITHSALSQVIAEGKRSGLPDLNSRGDIREARDAQVMDETEYGPMCQQSLLDGFDGRKVGLTFMHPLAFLTVAFAASAVFSAYFEKLHDETPSSPEKPWGISRCTRTKSLLVIH